MHKKKFSEKIIHWYRGHQRMLPWRETKDPYKIWISEIILQQTRVAQGFPYYLKFIQRFPDVQALAHAKEQEVLRLWQGLGYYTRARNLHRCAKMVVQELNGQFPNNFVALLKLPGVGPYTAAAIASIVFHEPVPVVDGNVYRVLSRIFGIDKDIADHSSRQYFFSFAKELISRDHPEEFNQGIMEFGAMHCTPKNPKCDECIFSKSCVAFSRDQQFMLPVNSKKSKPRKRYFYFWVIRMNDKIAMKRREGKDIWHGLYDFYAEETTRPQKPEKILAANAVFRKIKNKIETGTPSAVYKHLLTHQILLARFIPIKITSGNPLNSNLFGQPVKFYSAKEINKLPKPVLLSRYLSDTGFL